MTPAERRPVDIHIVESLLHYKDTLSHYCIFLSPTAFQHHHRAPKQRKFQAAKSILNTINIRKKNLGLIKDNLILIISNVTCLLPTKTDAEIFFLKNRLPLR